MRQYISTYTLEDLNRMMGAPDGYAQSMSNFDLTSLNACDWDGSTTAIVTADNVGGSQAPGASIGTHWEGLVDNGGTGSHSINWWHPDDASWNANLKSPQGIQLLSTTLNASSRCTVQNKSKTSWDVTGNNVACMFFMLRNIVTTRTTAEVDIGLGRYTQSTSFNGGADKRNGSINMFLGGSSNTVSRAYNTSNTLDWLQYNGTVSNTDNPFNVKDHDDLGVFIWRSPANSSQSTTTWKWRGGTIWNGKPYFWSESQISGVAEDINSVAGISGGVDWHAYVTHRNQQSNAYFAFQSAELWVGYF